LFILSRKENAAGGLVIKTPRKTR